MNTLSTILFWTGIICLTDGSLGILFQDKWRKLVGEINVERLALIEIAIALCLLGGHYFLRYGLA